MNADVSKAKLSDQRVPPNLLDELEKVAVEIANTVGELLAEALGRTRTHLETKSTPTDMVSEVDRQAEDLVKKMLTTLRPDDGLLAEEGSRIESTSGVRWIVDPLDGTTNYLFGIPTFAVSLAAERNGQVVSGAVFDVSRSEMWKASLGRGAWCNASRITVAEGRSTLDTALVATGFGYSAERRASQALTLTRVLPNVRDIRRYGAASLDLCWVAAGRLDGYYELGLAPWDMAAGRLICEEAGGSTSVLDDGTLLVSVPDIHSDLVSLVSGKPSY